MIRIWGAILLASLSFLLPLGLLFVVINELEWRVEWLFALKWLSWLLSHVRSFTGSQGLSVTDCSTHLYEADVENLGGLGSLFTPQNTGCLFVGIHTRHHQKQPKWDYRVPFTKEYVHYGQFVRPFKGQSMYWFCWLRTTLPPLYKWLMTTVRDSVILSQP